MQNLYKVNENQYIFIYNKKSYLIANSFGIWCAFEIQSGYQNIKLDEIRGSSAEDVAQQVDPNLNLGWS